MPLLSKIVVSVESVDVLVVALLDPGLDILLALRGGCQLRVNAEKNVNAIFSSRSASEPIFPFELATRRSPRTILSGESIGERIHHFPQESGYRTCLE